MVAIIIVFLVFDRALVEHRIDLQGMLQISDGTKVLARTRIVHATNGMFRVIINRFPILHLVVRRVKWIPLIYNIIAIFADIYANYTLKVQKMQDFLESCHKRQ